MNSLSVMGCRREIRAARVIASAPMLRHFRRPARAIPVVLAIAIATASCGIKGPLTLPAKAPPADAAAPADAQAVERKPAAP
jgi:predicted small lipoprotein YifL